MRFIKTPSFNLAVYSQGDPNAQKFALVIPGKCDSKDFAHMHSHVDVLATKGFFALTFDPPGTWESDGDITLYTMTNYLEAIDELIEHFGNRPTLLVGHSRGGKMAMIAGTRTPSIVAYVSIMSSLSGKEDSKPEDKQWKEKGYDTTYRSLPPGNLPRTEEFKLPYSFYEDQIRYFLTSEIKNCTKPKMFVVGTKDTIAPQEKVKNTYSALSEPKEIHEVDSDHDYWFHPEIMDEINRLLGEFIEKYRL